MEIAEKVGVKTSARMAASASTSRTPLLSMSMAASVENFQANSMGKQADDRGFEIMANVVWAEVGKAIMDELGSAVFAAGKPDEFRKVGVEQ